MSDPRAWVHLALYPIGASGAIFCGRDQSARFGDVLSRAVHELDALGELSVHGVLPEDIGAHSYRKGSSTFTTSGS